MNYSICSYHDPYDNWNLESNTMEQAIIEAKELGFNLDDYWIMEANDEDLKQN